MTRIDIELVNRGLFETRSKAQYAIKSGIVMCNNVCVNKNGLSVDSNDCISIIGVKNKYVSKGGLKLEKALKLFKIDFHNKSMIDIGSSTGGFTDCALQNGAERVLAIDVGTMQFSSKLRSNNKIVLMENTDFRFIDDSILKEYTIATIDVSFISALKLLPKLSECIDLQEIILLIKPQFEVGPSIAAKFKGVIKNKEEHINVIKKIINGFSKNQFNIVGLTYSPLKGGSGNIEYLIYFKKNADLNYKVNIEEIINDAFTTLVNRN